MQRCLQKNASVSVSSIKLYDEWREVGDLSYSARVFAVLLTSALTLASDSGYYKSVQCEIRLKWLDLFAKQ